jgi:hypothetical protein
MLAVAAAFHRAENEELTYQQSFMSVSTTLKNQYMS